MPDPFNLLYTASRAVDDVPRVFGHLDAVLARYGAVHLVHGDYRRKDDKLSIGPTCRKHLGVTPRQPVRLARTKPGGDCDGQTNLLETPDDA